MSDRIAIMREGQFEQIGTPEEIYEHPQTRFAAGFIGQTNLIEMDVQAVSEDGLTLAYGGASVPARRAEFPVQPGGKGRPEACGRSASAMRGRRWRPARCRLR